jgi:hypothetical protein
MYKKIKETVKSEYRGILGFDMTVHKNLTMTTAVVPHKESSKCSIFNHE